MHGSSKSLYVSLLLVGWAMAADMPAVRAQGIANPKAPAAPAPPRTPLDYFHHRLKVAGQHDAFFDVIREGNLKCIQKDFGQPRSQWLFLSVATPSRSVNLNEWSSRDSSGGELPLWWNAREKKWEVMRRQLEEASDAFVAFTWFFLRAYDGLDAALRDSNSCLAQGVPALVACEAVYRRTWLACRSNWRTLRRWRTCWRCTSRPSWRRAILRTGRGGRDWCAAPWT